MACGRGQDICGTPIIIGRYFRNTDDIETQNICSLVAMVLTSEMWWRLLWSWSTVQLVQSTRDGAPNNVTIDTYAITRI